MENQLKPNKRAFIFSRVFGKLVILFILMFVGVFISLMTIPALALIPVLFFIILGSLFYYLDLIVYKKLEYIFYDDKIIQKGGSLFTNYETELNIKNITHVKLRLPFIEHKLFKTGHVDIESAGSSTSEIHLCSMIEYDEIYSKLMKLMHTNGFNMAKGELVAIEKPNKFGVFFEVFRSFVIGLFVVFMVISEVLYDDDGNKNELIYDSVIEYIGPIIVLGVLIVFIYHIFKFLDLQKRVYKIYQNVITYKEGFLAKNYSILPFENLTDSGVTQTFVDKIFNLYDVKISCQGSGNEILFKNISNGKGMSDKLDELISTKSENVEVGKVEVPQPGQTVGQVANQGMNQKQVARNEADYDTDYTRDFKIDYNRTVKLPIIISVVSFILMVLSIILTFSLFSDLSSPVMVLIGSLFGVLDIIFTITFVMFLATSIINDIRYRSTKYNIGEKSIHYKFNFLSSAEIDFKSDKVTGVKITRSFIDRWFNVVSVNFWSIGASDKLAFSKIKKEEGIIESIVSKFGIRREEEILSLNSEFSLTEYLKSILPLFVILCCLAFFASIFLLILNPALFLAALIFVLVIFGLYYWYNKEYYKRTKIVFYKSFVYYRTGWLFKRFYYAKYRDIKDIVTVRYPLSNEGKIKFNVSGETVRKTKNGPIVTSNNFTIDYVQNIKEKDELIDYILHNRPSKNKINEFKSSIENQNIVKPVTTIKPSLKNTMVPLIIFLTPFNLVFILLILINGFNLVAVGILMILIVFNSLLIIPIYLPIRMTTYILDGYRVLSKSGVFYKKQVSVIYDKIDFINNKQGMINKMFKNGNVTVNTVGSSKTELSITNIPGYLDFYKELKSKYEGR